MPDNTHRETNRVLRYLRENVLKLSQEEIAEKLGVGLRTYQRWEQGLSLPQPKYRRQLESVFQRPYDTLGFSVSSLQSTPTTSPLAPNNTVQDEARADNQKKSSEMQELLVSSPPVDQSPPANTASPEFQKLRSRRTLLLLGSLGLVTSAMLGVGADMLLRGSSSHAQPTPSTTVGNLYLTYTQHHQSVNFASWSPDGKRIASASDDTTVQIWDAHSGKTLHTCTGHTAHVSLVEWSPDGRYLASASWDRTIRVWDAGTGILLTLCLGHTDKIWSVAWSPDGQYLISASDDRTVRVWNAHTGTFRFFCGTQDNKSKMKFASWSPKGTAIAGANADNLVLIWNAESGATRAHYIGHQDWVECVAWSPDGTYLASSGDDMEVIVWDTRSGKAISVLHGHHDVVWSVSWSPDGTHLASASWDGTVVLWSVHSWQKLFTYRGHGRAVESATWSPDGTRIASASWEGTVQVWSTAL